MNVDSETINLSPEIQTIIDSVKQGTNLTTNEVIEIIIKQYFAGNICRTGATIE